MSERKEVEAGPSAADSEYCGIFNFPKELIMNGVRSHCITNKRQKLASNVRGHLKVLN